MSEVYFSGDISRTAYANDLQPVELYRQLKAVFPWVKSEQYFSISDPSYHEVLQEPVITCNPHYPQCKALAGDDAAIISRKFCMDSATSFLRVYKLPVGAPPAWLPSGANLLLVGNNFEEFGRPFNPKAKTFTDFYFGGRPEVIEEAFNLPVRRGEYETWYGATVKDGNVVRVKQYCYDEQTTFSDWDVTFIALCKRHNRLDLM